MIKAQNDIDKHLLEGILKADSTSVKKVYDLALPSVITFIKENSGSESDARDIFQEAIMALFRRLEKGNFELTCLLKSYLRIMCRNLWMTHLRDKKTVSELSANESEIEIDDSIQLQIENSERNRLFLKHFDQLEGGCRKILAMFFEKTPLKEIAEKLDTSLGYIKKRKFVCKERLVEAVQNDPLFGELKN